MANKIIRDVDSAPTDELGHFNHHFSITMELDKHPALAAMGAIALVLIVLYVLRHGVTTKANVIPATPAPTPVDANRPYILASGQNPLPVTVANTSNYPVPVATVTNNPPAVTASSNVYTTTKSASLETTPRNSNGGHTILTIPAGAKVTLLSTTPTPDPAGSKKVYYTVQYNGQTGYIGSDSINV